VFDKKKSCYMYFTIEINQITCSEEKRIFSHYITMYLNMPFRNIHAMI